MGILDFIGYALKFLWALFGKYLEWSDEQKKLEKKAELTESLFQDLVTQVVTQMRWNARRESDQARKVEDQLDQARKDNQP